MITIVTDLVYTRLQQNNNMGERKVEENNERLAEYEHDLIRLSMQLEKIKKEVREFVEINTQKDYIYEKAIEAALNAFAANMDQTINAANRSIYDLDSICWFML